MCRPPGTPRAATTRPSPSYALEDRGGAHAAADAHGHESVPDIAAPHLVEQCRRQLGAGTTQRVAEGDRATVDIQPLRIDRQLAQAREDLHGERLIELDQVDLIEGQAGPGEHLADCRDRSDAE